MVCELVYSGDVGVTQIGQTRLDRRRLTWVSTSGDGLWKRYVCGTHDEEVLFQTFERRKQVRSVFNRVIPFFSAEPSSLGLLGQTWDGVINSV